MWPLKCIEHTVLVQQRDCDPEIHSGEPPEPANCKKGISLWLIIALPYRKVVHLKQALKSDKQSTTHCLIVSLSR